MGAGVGGSHSLFECQPTMVSPHNICSTISYSITICNVCMYIYIYIYVYRCVYNTYIYIYIYTHTHTHTLVRQAAPPEIPAHHGVAAVRLVPLQLVVVCCLSLFMCLLLIAIITSTNSYYYSYH